MGTSCAPSYANLYLGGWERNLFSNEGTAMYLHHILLWRRYIDDVLLIWTGSVELLNSFMELLSHNKFNLKFTIQFDTTTISFLDLRLVLREDGSIFSTLYRKETAGNTILHSASSHPRTLIHSIPYSQYLRIRRNCARDEDFEREARALYDRLLNRGYSKKVLKRAYQQAKQNLRDTLIFKQKVRDSHPTIKLITTFTAHQQEIRNLISNNWHFLSEDPVISKYVANVPQITYRRSRSISDAIVHSHLQSSISLTGAEGGNGTFRCGHCQFCPWIKEGIGCSLPRGGFHKLKGYADCTTTGIVYLAMCRCGAFYIGKTKRRFARRIQDHLYYLDVGLLYTPICKHIGLRHSYDPNFVTFFALEVISEPERGGNVDKKILQRETRWIYNQRATSPPGLNTALAFTPFL